jgi:caffeoyl-CoA O-methyltransferase
VEIIDPRIAEYIERFSSPHDPLLAEVADETQRTLASPGMLTGPIAGRLLEMLVWIGQPRRVLEIGTYRGHSALAMAAALPEDGHVDTLDIEPKHAAVAQRYFDRSPDGSKITLHLGPAIETIGKLEGEFDLVFIDADKTSYDEYYESCLKLLRAGPQ